MNLRSSAKSDIGRKRRQNEDCFVENNQLGLFVVADGMGGHNAGEIASRLACDWVSGEIARRKDLLADYVKTPSLEKRRAILRVLEGIVQQASAVVYESGEREAGQHGMGTTLSTLLIAGPSAFIAHVGDSRIYLLRDEEIHQLTDDHTLLAEHVRKGLLKRDEADEMSEFCNIITRGVGILPSAEVDTLHVELAPNDRFLLCSDGLYDYLDAKEIGAILGEAELESTVDKLIELANGRGGRDNLTALAVEIADLVLAPEQVEVRRKLEVLRQIPLFSKLSYAELVKILNIVTIKHAHTDELLIREGEEGDRFFIIVQGAVDVFKDGVSLVTLERGGHFGEMSLVSLAPRSATVRAALPTSLLVMGREEFFGLLESEPPLAIKVLLSFVTVLSERLSETNQSVSDWRRRFLEQELSH